MTALQRVLVLESDSENVDYWSGELWALGATAIEERNVSKSAGVEPTIALVASFHDDRSVEDLAKSLAPRAQVRIEHAAPVDWANEWKKHFSPTLVSPRIFVCPTWNVVEPPSGAHTLVMDAGPAFGSGTHETTQLALRAIDQKLSGGESVLDVGCGSGILAIAAALLGADHVAASDIDEAAVEYAKENVVLNGVETRVRVFNSEEQNSNTYDFVVANIQLDILQVLEPEFWRWCRRGGLLVLTGLLNEQRSAIESTFERWKLLASEELRGWLLVVFQKEDGP